MAVGSGHCPRLVRRRAGTLPAAGACWQGIHHCRAGLLGGRAGCRALQAGYLALPRLCSLLTYRDRHPVIDDRPHHVNEAVLILHVQVLLHCPGSNQPGWQPGKAAGPQRCRPGRCTVAATAGIAPGTGKRATGPNHEAGPGCRPKPSMHDGGKHDHDAVRISSRSQPDRVLAAAEGLSPQWRT